MPSVETRSYSLGTGSDGKPYAIGFAVALPENWNGRFLFQGGGGLNGNVGLPIGAISPPEIAVAIMGEITSRLRLTAEGKR